MKMHITLGHQTAIGTVHFFSRPADSASQVSEFEFNKGNLKNYDLQYAFDESLQYDFEDEIADLPSEAGADSGT
jgi:hypothetical protein